MRIMKPSTRFKLRLIKKYAKIRFKRFWREWGITKHQALTLLEMIGGGIAFYLIVVALIILL